MGCGYDYICRTCKKSYKVGYGSYGTWFAVTSLAEWDKRAEQTPAGADLLKNQNIRKVLVEHAGHDIYAANRDHHGTRQGALMGEFGPMGADVVIIPDYADYEHVDLDQLG